MSGTLKKIYCIPGQGVDHTLFSRLELPGFEMRAVKWVEPEKNETMLSYAKKLSAQIDTSQPFYLMGVSLGGMLCVELSEILNPIKTIIISSAKNRNELPLSIKFMKYFPIHKLQGNNFSIWMGIHNRWLFGVSKKDLPLFEKMLLNPPKNFYRYTSHFIINWKRTETLSEKIIHIHGDSDLVIPLKKRMNALLIEGGEHFMVMNEWKEISELIRKNLTGH
ncbi:MAG: hypothetical protein IAF38_00500 [Bacteroidia bacterium]|nr:hypothetical protein [Bacteroidia bacterium]